MHFASDEVYNLNLIIDEHFDRQINQIDIHTEELLLCGTYDVKDQDELNQERQSIISHIERVKHANLIRNSGMQEEFEAKWASVIEDSTMSYQTKLELVKSDYITPDCFLVKDLNFGVHYSLWVTSWFNKKHHVDFRSLFLFNFCFQFFYVINTYFCILVFYFILK